MNEESRLSKLLFIIFNIIELRSFLSTPKFIKALTDLSLTLSKEKAPKDVKLKMLKEEIRKINEHLPASVYIPFVNSNYS